MTVSSKQRSSINTANAKRRSQGFWNAARVALLCKRWQPGANVFDIANEIGDGCTRSMVIGKANRLGLSSLPVNRSRASERNSEAQKEKWSDPLWAERQTRAIRRAAKKHWSDPVKAKAHAAAISRGWRARHASQSEAAQ